MDAHAWRRPVLEPDLRVVAAIRRWPGYAPAAFEAGVRAVFAFPLQIGAARLGVLDVGLLQERAIHSGEIVTEQLQGALNSRIVIEQAKGLLAGIHGVDLDQAFNALRGYARSHNRRLVDLAHAVIKDPTAVPELTTRQKPRR